MESDLQRSRVHRFDPDVRDWRRLVLRHAGFGNELARALADDADVDLHDLLQLVDRQCPPDLAARIVAPL